MEEVVDEEVTQRGGVRGINTPTSHSSVLIYGILRMVYSPTGRTLPVSYIVLRMA
jgi:hypothetical protein